MQNNLYDIIEKLNKENIELKDSKEYHLGCNIMVIKKYLKSFQFKKIHKWLHDYCATKVIRKKYNIRKVYQENYENNKEDYTKKRIAVYTCIVGNYDDLKIPLVKFNNVDFYLITNCPQKYKEYEEYFKIIKIPDEIDLNNNVLLNRYIKLHPFSFFESYDYAIYIDGSIQVISDIRKMITFCSKKTGLALHRHSARDCIYNEAKACKLWKRGNYHQINEQMIKYKSESFPEHYGMFEAGVIVVDMQNKNAMSILEAWWNEFCNTKSMRDQLALPYVLWKNGYQTSDIGCLGISIFKNYTIRLNKHN